MKDAQYIIVFVTAKDQDEGRKIAQSLLAEKLAACINIVPGVESHYRWEGKLEQSSEVLLVIKSRKALFAKLSKAVKASHSYSVPEVLAFPVTDGEKNYLAWLSAETT